MTIANQTARIEYTGDGATTAFAVPFYFQVNADLVVYLQDTLGNLTLQVFGTQYNLAGATVSAGGTCTFTTAPTTGYKIIIYRDPAATQTTSYNNNDPFPAKSHELALDKLTTLVQRVKDQVGRTLHLADGEAGLVTQLPAVSVRKNKLLSFDTNGVPTYSLGPNFVSGTFVGVAEVDSRATAAVTVFPISVNVVRTNGFYTAGDNGAGVYIRGISTSPGVFQDGGGVYWALQTNPMGGFNSAAFGTKGDGTTDDTVALQAAITAAAGREVYVHSGTYVITSQLQYITSTLFVSGIRLRGAGMVATVFDNRVANNAMISVGGGTSLFSLGGYLRDFTIKTTTHPVVSHGIEQRAMYQFDIANLYITGLSGDGIRVTASLGDADASNNLRYSGCFIELCAKGINCNFAALAVQTSYMRVDNCVFASNAIGWRCIGLSHSLINSAFVTHTTYALQIVNNGVSNAQFTSIQTGFENNAQAIQADALQGGTFIQTELAGANAFVPSTIAVSMGSSQGIEFSGTRVRISSTPHTLFVWGVNSANNKIGNSFYQNYDNAGQVRYTQDASCYAIRLDDTIDPVVAATRAGVTSIACVNGANNNLAIPVDGAAFGIGNGTTGAYNITGFTNGSAGRRLTLLNNSGQTLTLKGDNVGSTITNRIQTENDADVTINNLATFTLIYLGDSKWHYLGKG